VGKEAIQQVKNWCKEDNTMFVSKLHCPPKVKWRSCLWFEKKELDIFMIDMRTWHRFSVFFVYCFRVCLGADRS